MPSSTQLAESKFKETDFYTSTGEHESNVSKLSMMLSVLIPEATAATKDNHFFINRKRRNEDAIDYIHGSTCNAEVLAKTCGHQEEL